MDYDVTKPTTFEQAVDNRSSTTTEDNVDVTHLQYAKNELERARKNLHALQVLKNHTVGDDLTSDEKNALLGWSGWGGASKVFDLDPQGEFLTIQNTLKELLTEEEYHDARHSCLTAFYTPSEIIEPIYKVLEEHNLFDKDRKLTVLEPSCGIGNMKVFAPENTTFDMVELDSTSANIAQLLHPDAHVINSGYENTELQGKGYDLAISNVPFGDIKIGNSNMLISDWFANRMISDTAQNGITVVIANSGLMDKKNTRARFLMSQNADLIGQVRLPRSAFKKHGTDNVVTDILIFRKREKAREESYPDWVDTIIPDDVAEQIPINKFVYHNRATGILGELKPVTRRFGKVFDVIEDKELNLSEAIYNSLHKQITRYIDDMLYAQDDASHSLADYLPNENTTKLTVNVKEHNVKTVGQYSINEDGEPVFDLGEEKQVLKFSQAKDKSLFVDLVQLSANVSETKAIQSSNASDKEIQDHIAICKAHYDNFVTKYGRICTLNLKKRFPNDAILVNAVLGLEEVDSEGKFKKIADVLEKRVIKPRLTIPEHPKKIEDVLHLSLQIYNKVDLDFISSVWKKDVDQCIEELDDQIYYDGNEWVTKEKLTSGLVAKKLENVENKIYELRGKRSEELHKSWLHEFSGTVGDTTVYCDETLNVPIYFSYKKVLFGKDNYEKLLKTDSYQSVKEFLQTNNDYLTLTNPTSSKASVPVNYALKKILSSFYEAIVELYFDDKQCMLINYILHDTKNIEHLFPKQNIPINELEALNETKYTDKGRTSSRIPTDCYSPSECKELNLNFFKTNCAINLLGLMCKEHSYDYFTYLMLTKGIDKDYIVMFLRMEQSNLKHDRSEHSILESITPGFTYLTLEQTKELVEKLTADNSIMAEYCYVASMLKDDNKEYPTLEEYKNKRDQFIKDHTVALTKNEERELNYLTRAQNALVKAQPADIEFDNIKNFSLASPFLTPEDISEFVYETYVRLEYLYCSDKIYDRSFRNFVSNSTGENDKEYFCSIKKDEKGVLSLETNKNKFLSKPAKALIEGSFNRSDLDFGFTDEALSLTFFPPKETKNKAVYLDGLISSLISGRPPIIKDKNGEVDAKAVNMAWEQTKIIRKTFKEWIENSSLRKTEFAKRYNQTMNRQVPVSFKGDYLDFPGQNATIDLRDNQKNAVARCLRSEYGTLLAHGVGGGKTFEGITACMEARRIGKANKPLIVVPNSLVEQWRKEFMKLYPNANILVMDEDTKNNKDTKDKFWQLCQNGDWDAVIVPMSQFDRMTLNESYIRNFIDKEVEELNYFALQNGWTAKEFTLETYRFYGATKKILDKSNEEASIKFDELGFDMLVVDEAHAYKNLKYPGRINSAGINKSDAARAQLMKYKTMYMHSLGLSSNIVFMTGTPITNSLTELYVMQRYLAPQLLEDLGLHNIDEWLHAYTKPTVEMEPKAEGSGYALKQRIASFENLPELMNGVQGFMDTVTREKLKEDGYVKTPDIEHVNIAIEPTPIVEQAKLFFACRGYLIRKGKPLTIKKADGSLVEDNLLLVCSDARKLSLSGYLLDPTNDNLEVEPNGKLMKCVDQVVDIYNQTTLKPDGSLMNSTQMIFCDASTGADSTKFNVADCIKEKLIERGVPASEIAVISSKISQSARDKIYSSLNEGDIRVAIGSSSTLGTGVSAQKKLAAIHNLDCPWKPTDLEQRLGRIERDGNTFAEEENKWFTPKVITYIVKGSFDEYIYGTCLRKAKMVAQVVSNECPDRSIDDVSTTTLKIEQIQELTSDSQVVQELMKLKTELTRLELEYSDYENKRSINSKRKKSALADINFYKDEAEGLHELYEQMEGAAKHLYEVEEQKKTTNSEAWEGLTIGNTVYDGSNKNSHKEAQQALSDAIEKVRLGGFKGDLGTWCGLTYGVIWQSWQGSDQVKPYIYLKDPKTGHTYRHRQECKLVGQKNASSLAALPITSIKHCAGEFVTTYKGIYNKYTSAQEQLEVAERALTETFDKEKYTHMKTIQGSVKDLTFVLNKEENAFWDANEEFFEQLADQTPPSTYSYLTLSLDPAFKEWVYERYDHVYSNIQEAIRLNTDEEFPIEYTDENATYKLTFTPSQLKNVLDDYRQHHLDPKSKINDKKVVVMNTQETFIDQGKDHNVANNDYFEYKLFAHVPMWGSQNNVALENKIVGSHLISDFNDASLAESDFYVYEFNPSSSEMKCLICDPADKEMPVYLGTISLLSLMDEYENFPFKSVSMDQPTVKLGDVISEIKEQYGISDQDMHQMLYLDDNTSQEIIEGEYEVVDEPSHDVPVQQEFVLVDTPDPTEEIEKENVLIDDEVEVIEAPKETDTKEISEVGLTGNSYDEDLQTIIDELNLKPEETRNFLEICFRNGEIKTIGTDLDRLLPPVSHFGGKRAKVRHETVARFNELFDKYYNKENILNEDVKTVVDKTPVNNTEVPTKAGLTGSSYEEDLQTIIDELNLKPEDTRNFLEICFRNGEIKTIGSEFNNLLPPISRFSEGGRRTEVKRETVARFNELFDKYYNKAHVDEQEVNVDVQNEDAPVAEPVVESFLKSDEVEPVVADTTQAEQAKSSNSKYYSKANASNLMTDEMLERVPKLYAQDGVPFADKEVHAAYIIPFRSNWTWYMTEYDSKSGNAFGLVVGDDPEWGYFNLQELRELHAERLILEDFPKTFRELKDTELVKQLHEHELQSLFDEQLSFEKNDTERDTPDTELEVPEEVEEKGEKVELNEKEDHLSDDFVVNVGDTVYVNHMEYKVKDLVQDPSTGSYKLHLDHVIDDSRRTPIITFTDNEDLLRQISLERPEFMVGDQVLYKGKNCTITDFDKRPYRTVTVKYNGELFGGMISGSDTIFYGREKDLEEMFENLTYKKPEQTTEKVDVDNVAHVIEEDTVHEVKATDDIAQNQNVSNVPAVDTTVPSPQDKVATLLENPQEFVSNMDNLKWLAEKLGFSTEFDKLYGKPYVGIYKYEMQGKDGSTVYDKHLDELEYSDIVSLRDFTEGMQQHGITIPQALIEADKQGMFDGWIDRFFRYHQPYTLGILCDKSDKSLLNDRWLVTSDKDTRTNVFGMEQITLSEAANKIASAVSTENYEFIPVFNLNISRNTVFDKGLLADTYVTTDKGVVSGLNHIINSFKESFTYKIPNVEEMCGYVDIPTWECMPVYDPNNEATYTHAFDHIYNPLGVGDYYIIAKDVDDPECAWCLCGVDSLELRRVNVKQEIASVNIGFGKHLTKDKNFASGTPIEQVEKDFASKFKAYSDYSRKFDRELS